MTAPATPSDTPTRLRPQCVPDCVPTASPGRREASASPVPLSFGGDALSEPAGTHSTTASPTASEHPTREAHR